LRFYIDTSALVKVVVEEPGSDIVAPIALGARPLFTCRIAYPEARAALAAAHRVGRLGPSDLTTARADLETAWQRIAIVEVTPALAGEAGDLAERHGLRGFDAMHLAAAVTVSDGKGAVVTWDARLWTAARAVGLSVLPREQPRA
jgi:predicted nucleic acid-binding protein